MNRKPKELFDGLNHVTNADYHADRKYLSSSVLKVLYKDLADYKAKYIDGTATSSIGENAAIEGSLTHAILLDPATVKTEFAFYPGLRKAGADWEAFKSKVAPNKLIVSKPQKLRVDTYIAAAKKRPEAIDMLSGGFGEQTICGSLNGVPIKVRFDYVNVDKGEIYDVKTTGYSADRETFKQTIDGLSYQLSAALYTAMAEQFYGKPFTFYFIVISKQDLVCEVYKTGQKTMAEGRQMVDEACAKYLKAKESGIWVEPPKTLVAPSTPQLGYEILEV
jgi:hypothetical protein